MATTMYTEEIKERLALIQTALRVEMEADVAFNALEDGEATVGAVLLMAMSAGQLQQANDSATVLIRKFVEDLAEMDERDAEMHRQWERKEKERKKAAEIEAKQAELKELQEAE